MEAWKKEMAKAIGEILREKGETSGRSEIEVEEGGGHIVFFREPISVRVARQS